MSVLSFATDHPVVGLYPVANAFAGTVYSDIVNLANYASAEFTIIKGVGASGTATITMEACDNANGDNPVAVPFYYQAYTGSDDVPGAVTAATTAGFVTTAGSNQRYEIQVDSQKLGSKSWLRLKSVEVVASAVLGMIDIELEGPRYATDIPATAIA
jgi:hypothetical protein